jgi:hypothetical protein
MRAPPPPPVTRIRAIQAPLLLYEQSYVGFASELEKRRRTADLDVIDEFFALEVE